MHPIHRRLLGYLFLCLLSADHDVGVVHVLKDAVLQVSLLVSKMMILTFSSIQFFF